MSKLLLITHGKLSFGFVDTLEMIVGSREDVFAISLEMDESPEILYRKIDQVLQLEDEDNNKVIILVDLFGATPFNVASKFAYEHTQMDISILSGVNLPMLFELFLHNTANPKDYKTLVQIGINKGKEGIVLIDNMKDGEE